MHSGGRDLILRERGAPLLALALGLTTPGCALPAQGVGLTVPKLGATALCGFVTIE